MNRISNKIQSFQQINTSSRFNIGIQNLDSEENIESPTQKKDKIKVFLYMDKVANQNLTIKYDEKSIINEKKSYNFDGIFTNLQNLKDLFKELINHPVCKTLEGFNTSLVVLEKNSVLPKYSRFANIIISYLNYLKKLLSFLQQDNINSFHKISFFGVKNNEYFDFFEEEKELAFQKKIEEIKILPFFEIDEIIKIFNYKIENDKFINSSKIENFSLFFRNFIILTDLKNKICWRGEFLISQFGFENEEIKIEFLEQINNNSESEINHLIIENKHCTFFCDLAGEEEIEKKNQIKTIQLLNEIRQKESSYSKNEKNDINDYFSTLFEYQKLLNTKDNEISTLKLDNFLKEKENDVLQLKISELEGKLQAKTYENRMNESNRSNDRLMQVVAEKNQEARKKTSESFDDFTFCKEEDFNYSIKSEERCYSQNIKLKIETVGKECQSALLKSERKTKQKSKGQQEMIEINGQSIEVSYLDELNLLREKFHDISKKLTQSNQENTKLKKTLESFREINELNSTIEIKTKEEINFLNAKLINEIKKKEELENNLKERINELEFILKLKENTLEEAEITQMKTNFKLKIFKLSNEKDNINKKNDFEELESMIEFTLGQLNNKSRKNKELQKELIDLYEVYSNLNFQKKPNRK